MDQFRDAVVTRFSGGTGAAIDPNGLSAIGLDISSPGVPPSGDAGGNFAVGHAAAAVGHFGSAVNCGTPFRAAGCCAVNEPGITRSRPSRVMATLMALVLSR